MPTVYIGSTAGYSGKSMVTVGLALKMIEDGLKVGYMKPYGRVPEVINGRLVDGDVVFMKQRLGLAEDLDVMSPVVYSQDLIIDAVNGRAKNLKPRVMKAFAVASKDKDVMLVGGARDINDGSVVGMSGYSLIQEMDAKVVIVNPYSGEVCLDCLLAFKDMLGPRLIGTVINRVPPQGVDYLRSTYAPFLKKRGINLLGILPTDKIINSATIRQLNETMGGKVLCCEDKLDELVENFSIGAMDVESAIKYFRRVHNKAVITGGHRSDIQLAALETSTKCLLLTGDMLPNNLIIAKAKAAGVPVITVHHDTLTTVEIMESMIGKVRIREEKKVERVIELMKRHFDFEAFYKLAGIKNK